MWIADAARCREMDRRATEEFGIPLQQLMERAGAALWRSVSRHPGSLDFVCGTGNNGGDGLVAARLALEAGRTVRIWVAGDPATGSDLFRQNLQGLKLEPLPERLTGDVVIDAVLGTGSRPPLREPALSAIRLMADSGKPIVSADIPSGIDPDTGRSMGSHVNASETVTFGWMKPCFFLSDGLEACGRVTLDDLSFPAPLLAEPTDAELTAGVRLAPRRKSAHKGSQGSVLVVGGCEQYRGAPVLAARGALRSGAGLVALAAPEAVISSAAASLPEAIFVSGQPDWSRLRSAIFGPGLGRSSEAGGRLEAAFSSCPLPCVVDADALWFVSQGLTLPKGPCVLTPHPGEMAMLMGCSAEDVQEHRWDIARAACSRFGATVLLKGAHTVVASPDEPLAVNGSGCPGMAAAGMGDVLAGVIGALLARGFSPHEAARVGAWLHGSAGERCEKATGAGFLASELADALPYVVALATVPQS